MKSINILRATICLIIAIMVFSIKLNEPEKSDILQVKATDHSVKFEELLTDPKRLSTLCDCDKLDVKTELLNDNEEIPTDPDNNNPLWSLPRRKKNIWAKKIIVWDASSYFFDYIDPIYKNKPLMSLKRFTNKLKLLKKMQFIKNSYTIERMANPSGD